MLNTPFAPWPSFTDDEIEAVSLVLRSNKVNYWTGEECRKFEAEFSEWTGAKHSIALANGTVAIEVALKALGIGEGDEVIVTPRSFFASASSVVNVGAIPVFADVDLDSGNMSVETVLPKITPKTKALMPVHLAGWPCDMVGLMKLAREKGIRVIEDCAQAHGARVGGQCVGTFGDVSAWSFCQDKIITTGGEGGMVTTNDKDLWSKMWSLKDHGKTWHAVYERQHAPGFRWVHETFGSNYRMTEMQAAIGRIQLGKIAKWTKVRHQNAAEVRATLLEFSKLVRAPECPKDFTHAYYKLYAYVRPENLGQGWSRDRIVKAINDAGVPCYQGSCPEIYLEKAFDGSTIKPSTRLKNAQELGETSIMFLVHPTLTTANIDKTKSVIAEVFRKAAK